MITSKAIKQVLAGIERHDQDYCYSTDPDCDCELDHDVYTEPSAYGITYVAPNGSLDKALNEHVFGRPWGSCGDLANALDQPTEFPDGRELMVVIERATGSWRAATAYFD